MPKGTRGGRRTASASASISSVSSQSSTTAANNMNVSNAAPAASSSATQINNINLAGQYYQQGPVSFSKMTDNEADTIRKMYDQHYNPDTAYAVKTYISNTQNAQGYSKSQTMNYKMDLEQDLNKTEENMLYYMENYMHPLGKDSILQRGCHADFLERYLNIKNYDKMSEAQLKSALIGKNYQNKSFESFSYDVKKNPFLSSSAVNGGGREIEINLKAKRQTRVLFGAKNQTELVLGLAQRHVITNVYYKKDSNGNVMYATPRNSGRKPILVLEIEV